MRISLFFGKLALSACLISFGLLIQAQSRDRKFVSARQIDNKLEVTVSDGIIVFTPYLGNAMGVEFVANGRVNPPSNAIVKEPSTATSKLKENPAVVSFTHQRISVKVIKNPFHIVYQYDNKPFLTEENGYFDSISTRGFRLRLADDEKLMGGGERVLGMDRRGNRLRLYNQASYGYETKAELMYYSLPVVISSKKYMLAFDNGADGWLDLGATKKDILEFEAVGGRMAFLLVASDSWPDLVSSFTEVTGRQPMLPRWALGNISSRMGYHSQKQVEDVVDKYIQNDIPLDAIVLDLYWFGKDLKGTLGMLDWYRDSFPEPKQMMAKLKSKGVNTILITEPFVLENIGKYAECKEKQLFGTDTTGNPFLYDFYFGHTALLDIFKTETRNWFWDIYKKHTSDGVAGWWGDLGEPEVHPSALKHVNGNAGEVHNLYGHEWARTIYDGFSKDFPLQRPVILMRSGFIGSQRYGLLPWSGDVSRSWGGLQPQVEIALQMGMQGLSYMSSDLGGFAGNYKDAELYTRWLQYGVFQPVYRTHAQEEVPAEPIFWDETTKNIVRRFIKLRYEMLPYNYTLMHENSVNGSLLMRPLFFVDDKPELLDEKSAYLWGESFLVSPVVSKGATGQKVYLPKGSNWIDFWTNKSFTGGQEIVVPLDINTIPVFVKAGSLIPMANSVQSTSVYDPSNLNVVYYFDPTISESRGYMYEDDGETKLTSGQKAYEMFEFFALNEGKQTSVSINSKGFDYKGRPDIRVITLTIPNIEVKPEKILVDGMKVKVKSSQPENYPGKPYAYWDKNKNILKVVSEVAKGSGKTMTILRK
jgi:oligosaccharide 4-alpha-D-glucosyltransferase